MICDGKDAIPSAEYDVQKSFPMYPTVAASAETIPEYTVRKPGPAGPSGPLSPSQPIKSTKQKQCKGSENNFRY